MDGTVAFEQKSAHAIHVRRMPSCRLRMSSHGIGTNSIDAHVHRTSLHDMHVAGTYTRHTAHTDASKFCIDPNRMPFETRKSRVENFNTLYPIYATVNRTTLMVNSVTCS